MSNAIQITRQAGLSLVELMVAMILGLILVGGVIQIYISNNQTYRVTEAASRIQESGRAALRILSRHVRMAGFTGCAGKLMSFTNTLNGASNPGFLYDFDIAIQGFEGSGGAWNPALDASITNVVENTDVLSTRGAFSAPTAITGQPNNASDCPNAASHTANLKVDDPTGLAVDDIVIASNCSQASIFQITDITASIIGHAAAGTTPGNSTDNIAACYAGSGQLSRISTVSFFIRNNPNGIPSLYRQEGTKAAEEYVEGVEDMQITFGIGDGVSNLVNQFVTADNITDWDDVISVRIALLLRSVEDNITTQAQTYTFNGNTETATDRALRRVYTTTVAIRNRMK